MGSIPVRVTKKKRFFESFLFSLPKPLEVERNDQSAIDAPVVPFVFSRVTLSDVLHRKVRHLFFCQPPHCRLRRRRSITRSTIFCPLLFMRSLPIQRTARIAPTTSSVSTSVFRLLAGLCIKEEAYHISVIGFCVGITYFPGQSPGKYRRRR